MDLWSLGCVFAEMVERRTLFCTEQPSYSLAENESIQAEMIFSVLGLPDESTWNGVTLLRNYFKVIHLQINYYYYYCDTKH